MRVRLRIAAFAAIVLLALGAGAALGAAVGPIGEPSPPAHEGH